MRETLYIRLRGTAPDTPTPYRVDGAGTGLTLEAPLENVLTHAHNRRVVVLVPGAEVRLTAVSLPVRQAGKALQAVPYAIEEQLAEDVDTLHFALGPRQADGSFPVAVVSRQRMDEWLAPLAARGLRADMLVPEPLCLPVPEAGQWTALTDGETLSLRTAAYAAFACPLSDAQTYLDLADPDRTVPLQLLLPAEVEVDTRGYGRPVETRPGYGQALDELVRHLQVASTINLLQGDYAASSDLKRLWQPWRLAAVLAAVCIVLALVHRGIDTWRLGQAVQAQEQANLERFKQVFPGYPNASVEQVPALLGSELRRREGGDRAGSLFFLLGKFAGAIGSVSGLKLQGAQFRDDALYLNLTGDDLQALEGLRNWFAQQAGVKLDVESANAGSNGVQIRLKLSAA